MAGRTLVRHGQSQAEEDEDLEAKDLEAPLTKAEFVRRLATDPTFCADFSRSLKHLARRVVEKACGGSGGYVFLECAPFQDDLSRQPFACEVYAARDGRLASRAADDRCFRAHLDRCDPGQSTSFPNLGGDATLVAPKAAAGTAVDATSTSACCGHVGAFLEHGSPDAQVALWMCVGNAARDKVARGEHFWLSTHGGGVPWLHVRLDQTPKYFGGCFA